jgi:hypothetical protein
VFIEILFIFETLKRQFQEYEEVLKEKVLKEKVLKEKVLKEKVLKEKVLKGQSPKRTKS